MKVLCLILSICIGENLFAVGLVMNQSGHISETLRRDSNLLRAAIIGEENKVRDFTEQGGNVNTRGNNGITPLIGATERGNENIVRYLLDKECDVNAYTFQDKFSALLLACLKNYGNIAKMLINSGADVNWVNNEGLSPLIFATNNNNRDLVTNLALNGANIFHESKDGTTAISVAFNCFEKADIPEKNDRKKMIDLLMRLFDMKWIR